MVVTKRIVITTGWVLVFLATALLFFTIQLNSNTLFFEDLARNIFLYNGPWSAWQFTPTPAYIPDIVLYFIAFKLLPLPADRILFVSIAEALLIAWCSIWLAKKIQREISTTAIAAILAVVALTSFTAVHSNMGLYFDTINSQVPSFLFSLLALGFILKYLVAKKNISLLKFTITIVVAIVCDQLFIIGFYSTAVIVLLVYLLCLTLKSKLAQYKKYQIPLLNSLIVVIVAYPIAQVIAYFIRYDHAKLNWAPFSYVNFMNSLTQFKLAIINLFYPVNMFVWFYLILAILSLVTCFVLFANLFSYKIKKWKLGGVDPSIKIQFIGQADNPFTFCLIFLIFLIPVNFIGAMVSGNFQDIYSLRYFMLPIGLAFILTIIYLDSRNSHRSMPQDEQQGAKDHFIKRTGYFNLAVYALFIAIFIGIIATIIQQLHHHGWQRIRAIRHQGIETVHHEAAIAECIEQIQKVKSLHAGIADYWHSRGVSLRLQHYIPIMPMHSDLTPKTWLNTREPYLYPQKYGINYDFVILEKNGRLYNANTSSPFLPDGYEQHVCENAPVEIWTYNNGVLNTFLQAQIYKSFFINDEIQTLIWPAKLLKGDVGKVQGDMRVANAQQDHKGLLARALYLNLKPGYYKVTLNYKAKNARHKQAIGAIKIGRFNAPIQNKLLYKEDLYPENTTLTAYILIEKKNYTVQEVQIWYAGVGSLAISSIEFERLKDV